MLTDDEVGGTMYCGRPGAEDMLGASDVILNLRPVHTRAMLVCCDSTVVFTKGMKYVLSLNWEYLLLLSSYIAEVGSVDGLGEGALEFTCVLL